MVKVIKNKVFRLLAIVSGLIFSTIVPMRAQDLPLLPEDKAVRRAVMPDGLTCYVAENPYVKGFADFALVSRESGNALLSLRDVPSADESVTDSVLINIMKEVEAKAAAADLAVIACGDLKADEVLRKLRYMSYMIPASGQAAGAAFCPGAQSEVVFETVADSVMHISRAVARWTSPRTPMPLMNTVQTAVYDKTVHELGTVVCGRVRDILRDKGIPAADVTFRHVGSMNMVSDESFLFEVTVRDTCIAEAENALKAVLASVDAHGASASELILAEEAYFKGLSARSTGLERTNAAYVDMCARAFLMNAPLAASAQRLAFLKSKAISPQAREQIFSGIASALIGLPADAPSEDSKAYFSSSDTLSFPSLCPKVKLRSSKKEPLSGGTVWTFSNGFRVIYRKMPSGGALHYALAMNGGYGDMPDLAKGEGAFMSDYLGLCTISGMKARDFMRTLQLAGVTMDAQVNLSNVMISGQVHDGNAPLLMKALLAVANERALDPEAVAYHVESERLRLMCSPDDMRTAIDTLMCPDYRYSPYKSSQNLTEEFASKADALFAQMSSKMNDGVLVLVGDADESDIRKAILPYVGGFRTREVLPKRTVVQYQPVSGSMTYNVSGREDMMTVAVSARVPMTAENYMAAEISAMVLKHEVAGALAPYGVQVEMRHARRIYPEDRVSVMLMVHGNVSQEVLGTLRRAVAGASSNDVDPAYMAACKAYMKHKYAVRMQEPSYWLHALSMRYLDGKDYTTGYASKIDAVSEKDVKKILGLLEKGSRIEYIINSK